MDQDILTTLKGVNDPELGLNIVDLGLVYSAERTADGISVAMTMTSPSCPAGEMITREARDLLVETFPGTVVNVELIWDPAWTPQRVSEDGRRQLGWATSSARPERRRFGIWRH